MSTSPKRPTVSGSRALLLIALLTALLTGAVYLACVHLIFSGKGAPPTPPTSP